MFLDSSWQLIGHIDVDAGLCWIGDPCYILHKNKEESPSTIGKTWHEFCEILFNSDDKAGCVSFPHTPTSGEGLGVVVPTGCGDGTYPVYAKIKNNECQAILVDFFNLFDDKEDAPDDERFHNE